MISSIDFHKSGAKVRRNFEICKEWGGAGQNLICNLLSVSGLFSRRAAESTEYDAEVYFITHHILFFYHELNEFNEFILCGYYFLQRISRITRIYYFYHEFNELHEFIYRG